VAVEILGKGMSMADVALVMGVSPRFAPKLRRALIFATDAGLSPQAE